MFSRLSPPEGAAIAVNEVPGRSPKARTPVIQGSPPFPSFPFLFPNSSLDHGFSLDASQNAPSTAQFSPPESVATSSITTRPHETSPYLLAVHKIFSEHLPGLNSPVPPSPKSPNDVFGVTEYDLEQHSSWRDSLVLLKLLSALCIVAVAIVAFAIPIFLVIYNTAGSLT